MEKIEKNKKIKIERFSVLSLIGNIIFYGVLIFAMIMVVILHFNQGKNQMIPIFGYSIAVIQTGSMIDGGFNIGDKVLVKVPNTDNLRVGDIIVFYKYLDPADNTIIKINITEDIENYEETTEYNQEAKNALDESRLTQKEVMEKDAILIFHRITTIYADEFGTRFFQTKGDSNYGADSILVREDFVVGQHVETAGIITGFFNL